LARRWKLWGSLPPETSEIMEPERSEGRYAWGQRQTVATAKRSTVFARFPRRIAFLTILSLWPLSGTTANAQTCHVDGPRYGLLEDTIDWTMTIVNGRSCIRGVRFANIQIDSLKLSFSTAVRRASVARFRFHIFSQSEFSRRRVFFGDRWCGQWEARKLDHSSHSV